MVVPCSHVSFFLFRPTYFPRSLFAAEVRGHIVPPAGHPAYMFICFPMNQAFLFLDSPPFTLTFLYAAASERSRVQEISSEFLLSSPPFFFSSYMFLRRSS